MSRLKILFYCLLPWLMQHASLAAENAPMSGRSVDYGPAIKQIQTELQKELRDEKVAGASIAIIDDRQKIWSQGFGFADYQARKPATAGSVYQAGDFTKLITTIAVLRLVESGRLSLDMPLSEILPDLEITTVHPQRPVPTLRQLLSHHSGLPHNTLAGSYLAEPPSRALVSRSVFLAQPAGQIYTYSQVAFNLLGQVVSQETGQNFAEVVSETILKPLQMNSAGFALSGELARGHRKRKVSKVPTYSRDLAAMGLLASVDDLARLMQWFLASDTRPILARRWVDEMARVQNADFPLDLDNDAGLGWQLTNTGRHRVARLLRLNASTPDFNGIMLLAPDERLGVVLMANSSNSTDFVLTIGRRALDLILEANSGIQPVDRDVALPDKIPLAEGAKNDIKLDRYSTPLGLIEFSGEAERPDMIFLGRKFRAKRREDGWYSISYRLLGLFDIQFSFLTELLLRPGHLAGHRLLLGYYQGVQFMAGSALENEKAPVDLAHLAGHYRLLNPDNLSRRLEIEEVKLVFGDGRLTVTYRLPAFITLRPRLPLQYIKPGHFVIAGLGSNLGEKVLFSEDSRRFVYSGYTFERLD
jgi:CubicO group peptidase (beta-lactamase class C family)